MNELERLDNLRTREKELSDKWYAQLQAVTKKLYGMLELLNLGPAPLLPLREEEVVGIEDHDWPEKEGFKWKVRKEIYFVNQDPEDDRSYDFGSSFSLYITNLHITVNHGSCGTWGLDNKGQWSRLILMKAIFDHEQDIIDALDPLIDVSIQQELFKVRSGINQINSDIEKAKRERELAEIRKKVKVGKWLAQMGKRYHWDNEHKGHYINHYYNFLKITKITEVSVFVNECDSKGEPYAWITRRLRLSDVLSKLQYDHLHILDNPNEEAPQGDDK